MKNMKCSVKDYMIKTARDIADSAYEILNENFSIRLNNLYDSVIEENPTSSEIISNTLENAGLEADVISELIMAKLNPDDYWELYADYGNIFDIIQMLDKWADKVEEQNG